MMTFALRRVESEEDWRTYHEIRRTVLFEERGRFGAYNDKHPDEFKPGNTPMLLVADGMPTGTVRLDLRNPCDAVVRMVAVRPKERGKGHGKHLMDLVAKAAKREGRTRLVLNAAPEAVGFYRKLGFADEVWDQAELKGVPPGGVQMVKQILGGN